MMATQKCFIQPFIFCGYTIGFCKDHGKIYGIIHWLFSTSGCNRIVESVSWTWKLDQCDSWTNHSKWLIEIFTRILLNSLMVTLKPFLQAEQMNNEYIYFRDIIQAL